ncbi:hypothetical protein HrrHm1_250 [Halorubrum virus Humcor1]|nr:hypothetical protein HrrHm1_250 [Halorubrum virus Humcor1]
MTDPLAWTAYWFIVGTATALSALLIIMVVA